MSDSTVTATSDPQLDLLKDMKAWSEANPPREGWRARRPEAIVHLHPHVRVKITLERAAGEIGYGLWRTERMAELGVFCAENDSAQFARHLLQAIGPELSRRNLEHLLQAVREQQEAWG